MATSTFRPNANGHSWSLWPLNCTYNYQCVDEAISDEDSTCNYIALGGSGGWAPDYYALPDHTTEFGSISSVTAYARARTTMNYAASIRVGFYTYATSYYSASSPLFTSYADYSHTTTLNPYTNQPWTWSEIDNLEIYVSLFTGNYFAYLTQAWVVVTYTPSTSAGRRSRFLRF